MSDIKGQYAEAEKLVSLLRDIIGQRKIVENQPINWELLFKTADYHDVANMLYYATLRLRQDIPQEWALRISQKYRKAVLLEDQYKNVVEAVLWHCEEQGIHIMALGGYVYRKTYAMPEMRLLTETEFWVDRRRRQDIDRMMHRMDFVAQPGEYSYERSGMRLVFLEKLPFEEKKMARYFGASLRRMPRETGRNYVHILKEPILFVFSMCRKAQRFAWEEFGIRDMLDIWLYYRSEERGASWFHIMKRLKKLKVWDFANRMLTLTDNWFGSGQIETETDIYDDLKAFIFSKGAEGRQTAMKTLPLFKKTVRRKEKAEKKKRRENFEKWLFPGADYMQVLYPKMAKHKILLPLCWLRRLGRTMLSRAKQKFGKKIKKG